MYENSIGLGEPARRLAITYAVHSRKRKAKGNIQPKNKTCDLAKGQGMHTESLIPQKIPKSSNIIGNQSALQINHDD